MYYHITLETTLTAAQVHLAIQEFVDRANSPSHRGPGWNPPIQSFKIIPDDDDEDEDDEPEGYARVYDGGKRIL